MIVSDLAFPTQTRQLTYMQIYIFIHLRKPHSADRAGIDSST